MKGDWDLDGVTQDTAPEAIPSNPCVGAPAKCNVTLECRAASDEKGERQQFLTRCVTQGSAWCVGPRHQMVMFGCLLPERAAALPVELFELAFEPPCLSLRRLAREMTFLVKGTPVNQESFALWDKVEVSLCDNASGVPCMTFRVHLGEVAKDAPAVVDNARIRMEVDLRGKDTDEAAGCLSSLKDAGASRSKIVV